MNLWTQRKNRLKTFSFIITTAFLTAQSAGFGQQTDEGPADAIALAATLPDYDVSTVKVNLSGSSDYGRGVHNDRFTATNVSLKQLIEFAYDINKDEIVGLTGRINSARFDIIAKIVRRDGSKPPDRTDAQLAAMLIRLLVDRFHLSVHLETRNMPVYQLVADHGGPKFRLSQVETPVQSGWSASGINKSLNFKCGSMADLADTLTEQVHRKVVDRTGLTGCADFTLKWADDIATHQGSPDDISIFSAVKYQLGLKLQPSQAPVNTLVIDRAEMPSEK